MGGGVEDRFAAQSRPYLKVLCAHASGHLDWTAPWSLSTDRRRPFCADSTTLRTASSHDIRWSRYILQNNRGPASSYLDYFFFTVGLTPVSHTRRDLLTEEPKHIFSTRNCTCRKIQIQDIAHLLPNPNNYRTAVLRRISYHHLVSTHACMH